MKTLLIAFSAFIGFGGLFATTASAYDHHYHHRYHHGCYSERTVIYERPYYRSAYYYDEPGYYYDGPRYYPYHRHYYHSRPRVAVSFGF